MNVLKGRDDKQRVAEKIWTRKTGIGEMIQFLGEMGNWAVFLCNRPGLPTKTGLDNARRLEPESLESSLCLVDLLLAVDPRGSWPRPWTLIGDTQHPWNLSWRIVAHCIPALDRARPSTRLFNGVSCHDRPRLRSASISNFWAWSLQVTEVTVGFLCSR
jgi:hypothetical protein